MTNRNKNIQVQTSFSDELYTSATSSSEFFKNVRAFLKLSQEDIGRHFGVAKSTWHRFEHGFFPVAQMQEAITTKLAKTLGVDEEKLSKYLSSFDDCDSALYAQLPTPIQVKKACALRNQDLFALINELSAMMKDPLQCLEARGRRTTGYDFIINSEHATRSREDEQALAEHLLKYGWKMLNLSRWKAAGQTSGVKTKDRWVTTIHVIPASEIDG